MTKPLRAERAVRRQHRRKDFGIGWRTGRDAVVALTVVAGHAGHYRGTMAKKTTKRAVKPAARADGQARPQRQSSPQGQIARVKGPAKRAKADQKAASAELAAMDARRDRGSVPPLRQGQSGAARRAAARQSVHAVGRGRPLRAGDRRRRQQGDAGSVRARRHAAKDGGARRGPRPRV